MWTGLTKSLAVVALGYLLLVAHSTVSTLLSVHPFVPNLLLPIVIFLGVSPEVHIVRGAATAFVLGYMFDLFCGNPMSLQTVVMVATFMLARGAGSRLFLRGPLFQIVMTFVVGVLAGAAILALPTLFHTSRPPFPTGTPLGTAVSVVAPAGVTALAAPLVFVLVQRVEALVTRREDTGGASP